MSGALEFDARIHGDQLQRDIDQINHRIRNMVNGISNEGEKIDAVFKKIGLGIGAYFGTTQLASFVKEIANVRGEFQDLQTSFETILKSKSEADKLMAQVVQFAATTPFNLRDVASGTKQLLAYGFAAEDIVGNLRMLGDVAAGTGTNIGDLIYLYGTLQTQGRAYTKDIMQFTGRGIPIIGELAKQLGVAKDRVQEMVEAGRVGFPEVEKAFQSMAGTSGIFGGLMEKQSKNIRGQLSNLVDLFDQMKNKIGESNEGAITGSIQVAQTLVKNYESIGKAILSLVTVYGAYKAALIATAAIQSAKMFSENIQLVMMFRRELGLLTAAQQAFNVTASMNPYVAAIAGLTALVSLFMIFSKRAETTEDVIKSLNATIEQIGKQVEVDALIDKYEDLKKRTGKTKEEQQDLNDTIQKLALIFPDAISGTDKYGKAIDLVSDKLTANNQKLKEYLKTASGNEIEEAQTKLTELTQKRDELIEKINSGYTTGPTVEAHGYKATQKIELSPEKLKDLRSQVSTLTGEIENLYSTIEKNKSAIIKLDSEDAQRALEPFKNLFKEVTQYTKKEALQARDELVKLYGTLGKNADEAIQKQAQALNDYANGLQTIKQRIADTQTKLKDGKQKLAQMLLPDSTASEKEIENQKSLVDNLKKQLELLTGTKKNEFKGTYNQLEDAIKEASDAVINANERERPALQQKLANLIKQRVQLEQIIKLQREEQQLKQLEVVKPTIEPKTNGAKEQLKPMKQLTEEQRKQLKLESDKLTKDAIQSDLYQEQLNFLGDILGMLDQMIGKYAESLGLSEDQAKILKNGSNALKGMVEIASGNVLQGGFTLLTSALDSFIKAPEKFSERFQNINEQVQKIINSIDAAGESLTNIGKSQNSLLVLKSELYGLAESAKLLNYELSKSSTGRRRDVNLSFPGQDMIKQAADLNEEIEKLSKRLLQGDISDEQRKAIEAILDSYNSLVDSINSAVQDITGTTVNDLSEALTDAFLAGEDAAEVWGKKVNDIIKNVIAKQLTEKLLVKPVSDAINTLVNDSADLLTPDEADKFKKSIDAIYSNVAPPFEEAIADLKKMGIDLSSNNSNNSTLTGAISSITEDTAELMAGQLMAIREYQIKGVLLSTEMMDGINQQCEYLGKIVVNTGNTTEELKKLNNQTLQTNRILDDRL